MSPFKCWCDEVLTAQQIVTAQSSNAGLPAPAAEWLALWEVAVEYEAWWWKYQARSGGDTVNPPSSYPYQEPMKGIHVRLHVVHAAVEVELAMHSPYDGVLVLRLDMNDLSQIVETIRATWPGLTKMISPRPVRPLSNEWWQGQLAMLKEVDDCLNAVLREKS